MQSSLLSPKSFPQGLKPRFRGGVYVGAEAPPLQSKSFCGGFRNFCNGFRNFSKGLLVFAAMVLMVGGLQGAAAQGKGAARAGWRAATEAELEAVMPARAPVVNERIETEARSATGIADGHGHVIGAIVLITAGYAANGKYSHYLLAQSGLRIGEIVLKPGAYVMGWTRETDGLLVHVYDAATGVERGSMTAKLMDGKVTVVPVKIWPPGEKSVIQIGRFALPYAVEQGTGSRE